jgi:large subunit ribosomal protein L15
MRVDQLAPSPGANKAKRRVGRGIGGKGGKTAGFEGGQMPLKQRVPKLKGFNNPFRVEYSPVNLDQLEACGESTVDPEVLVAKGLVRKGDFVKVLARGEITSKIDVTAHGVSKAAEAAITAAGGSVTLLPLPFKQGRPPVKGNQFTNR